MKTNYLFLKRMPHSREDVPLQFAIEVPSSFNKEELITFLFSLFENYETEKEETIDFIEIHDKYLLLYSHRFSINDEGKKVYWSNKKENNNRRFQEKPKMLPVFLKEWRMRECILVKNFFIILNFL